MKISVFIFFIGIVHALLRDIGVSEFTYENLNSILDNKKYIDDDDTYSYISLKQSLYSLTQDDNLFELIRDFQVTFQTKQNPESETIEKLAPRSAPAKDGVAQKEAVSTEDVYFLLLLANFLQRPLTHQLCVTVLTNICPTINNYSATGAVSSDFITKRCANVTLTCLYLVKKMDEYCQKIKEEQNNALSVTKEVCTYHVGNCKYLEKACGESLKKSCAKIKTQCKKLENDSKVHEDTGFVNTHTQIVDETVYVTETVYYTHTSVIFTTKKCCSKKTKYKTCATKPTTCPALSTGSEACPTEASSEDHDPEPTKTSEDGDLEPVETSSEDDDLEPTETSSDESETETSSEEQEPVEEPEPTEEPTLAEPTEDEECTITKTITMTNRFGETLTTTVTVSEKPGETNKDQINNKGDSIKKEAFQKVGIFCLIIGVTTGVWIIV
ncbi:uncharacterized protein T551_02772 [Pneumocystis jirovecii RU7]|uniref:Uncharacterized protein n=1 Tax=Pneumocystis jirovecii (strain RU7) TaxID=1408657 RepID=A0A0W4ZJ05_PNEJ7|nr:uncharacterized protein T551_02772 [Pneumocystis jirovecii RU7]KTW28353.1 hypothetical protein T551_02772 [Pneumocystis jirovecii RU7]